VSRRRPLRVVAWNLLHGGGRRIPQLADAALAHEPDVCVLAESRAERAGEVLERLAAGGLVHTAVTDSPPRKNGILVAARHPFERLPPPAGPAYAQRWIALDLAGADLRVAAVHVPPKISIGVDAKAAFWDALLDFARAERDRPALIVGDLNTGAPFRDEHRATLYCADKFLELEPLGWVDAWRRFHGPARKEWTWASPRRPSYGYRLDHAFASPPLAERLLDCRYSHAERLKGISDHSILILEVAGGPPNRRTRRGPPLVQSLANPRWWLLPRLITQIVTFCAFGMPGIPCGPCARKESPS
jgi:exodeoxyribonuclease III